MLFERYLSVIHFIMKISSFQVYVSCLFLPTETLPWRRTSDLHVMLSIAVIAMLGWRLDREHLWEIFHQEEGRYVPAAPAETEVKIKSPEFCWKPVDSMEV